MYASKVDYLKKAEVYYVYYEADDEQVATVHGDTANGIIWEDGEEPYDGAAAEVLQAIKEAE